MDAWYRTKFQDMSDASARHVQSFRSLREELAGYKKEVRFFFVKPSLLLLSLKTPSIYVTLASQQRARTGVTED